MKNFIFEKKKISLVKRIRIPENRDLINGIRLNRNERVENFDRNKYHFSNLCFGASLKAIVDLMNEKNFSFVGTNLTRCNAFFVQNC